jgi:hypothetical protein
MSELWHSRRPVTTWTPKLRKLRRWKPLPGDNRWRYGRLRWLRTCCSELQSVRISASATVTSHRRDSVMPRQETSYEYWNEYYNVNPCIGQCLRLEKSKQFVTFSFIIFPVYQRWDSSRYQVGWCSGNALRFYSESSWSNLGRDTGYPEGFRGFSQSTHANAGTVPRLGQDHFHLQPYEFIIQQSYPSPLYSSRYWQSHAVNQKNNVIWM